MINNPNPTTSPQSPSQSPRVAIVHDWLYGGGAERVVDQLHKLYPDAPIYTGSATQEWRQRLDGKVITGWPNWWPFNKLRKYMPLLLGWWFSSLDLRDYDLIIVSTGNGEAKQIRKTGDAQVVCYCHTPVHFYWRHYKQYVENPGFGFMNPIARLGIKILVKPLRRRDYAAAQRIDHWLANSTHIQSDINTYYGCDSTVLHPPVAIDRFSPQQDKEDFLISVNRLVPAKRIDIIIEACNQLGKRLLVIGEGPEKSSLKALAGPTIKFRSANDEQVADALASAAAFVQASNEDFGITPIEALASGTPVIAYNKGGSRDFVSDKTGIFFDEQTVAALVNAIKSFNPSRFNQADLVKTAAQFDSKHFRENISTIIEKIRSSV